MEGGRVTPRRGLVHWAGTRAGHPEARDSWEEVFVLRAWASRRCLRPRRVQMDHSVMLVVAGAVVRAAFMLLARSPDPGSLGLGS